MNTKLKIAFSGGEPLGLPALEALVRADLVPELVICNPDRKSGRGLALTPPRIKVWAQEHAIEVFQPETYKDDAVLSKITETDWDLFVVVAYNFILPKWLLELPKHGTINVHPSLLPKLRGMSPIRTAILEDRPDEVGVSIMLMDEKMDHGPLLAQAPLSLNDWPIDGMLLDDMLAQIGGELLTLTIPKWVAGTITPTPQLHENATYTKRFDKIDSELQLDLHNLPTGDEARQVLCKIKAYSGIGDTFFVQDGIRVKIKSAIIKDDTLCIMKVTPEGKKEINFNQYFQTRD